MRAFDLPPAELSYIGKGRLNIGQRDSREPQELRLIALKNMRNLRVCHASMLLAFWGPAVLACHRVLKSAER